MSIVVDCGSLSIPVNGSLVGQGTAYKASVTFSCLGGHHMVGSAVRSCQSDGTWSGIQPICESNSPT